MLSFLNQLFCHLQFLSQDSDRVSLLAEASFPCIHRAVNTWKRGVHLQGKIGSKNSHDVKE